jgi:hypothetical protein
MLLPLSKMSRKKHLWLTQWKVLIRKNPLESSPFKPPWQVIDYLRREKVGIKWMT